MDSSYFLISNNTSTNAGNINNDLEQSSSSSSFNYDPFDGFSFLDQQGMRLYDYFGAGGGGRNSPLINQCSLDQLDLQTKNFPFQADPCQEEDEDDFHGTLTSFTLGDFGGVIDQDITAASHGTSGVDLFATNTLDCSDSTDQINNHINDCHSCGSSSSDAGGCLHHHHHHSHHHHHHHHHNNNNNSSSNINHVNNIDNSNNYNSNNNNNDDYGFNSYNCNGDSNISQTKRSVLMNLLIDGSDLGAGYKIPRNKSSNNRATKQTTTTS